MIIVIQLHIDSFFQICILSALFLIMCIIKMARDIIAYLWNTASESPRNLEIQQKIE